MAQINTVLGIQLVNQQRQTEDILKAVIRRKVELRLGFKRLFHTDKGFVVRTLDVRLNVARLYSAEKRIDSSDAGLNAVIGNGPPL